MRWAAALLALAVLLATAPEGDAARRGKARAACAKETRKCRASVRRSSAGPGVRAFAPAPRVVAPSPPSTSPTPAPAVPPPPPPPPPSPVDDLRALQVRGGEFFLQLSQPEVLAGPVSVEFNLETAEDPHDLWLVPESGPPAGFDEQPAGSVTTRTLQLSRGTYQVLCGLPQHAALGMAAELRVR